MEDDDNADGPLAYNTEGVCRLRAQTDLSPSGTRDRVLDGCSRALGNPNIPDGVRTHGSTTGRTIRWSRIHRVEAQPGRTSDMSEQTIPFKTAAVNRLATSPCLESGDQAVEAYLGPASAARR